MEKLSIILYLQFCCFLSFSQSIFVSANKFNLLYVGVDNPITIFVNNYLPEQIIVKVDKGEITGGMGNIFIYRGFDSGLVAIIAADKNTQKEIGRSYFRLKKIPNPIAKVSISNGGIINTLALKHQSYIRAELDDDFGFDIKFTVQNFKVVIIKKGKNVVKNFMNYSNKFSVALEKELKLLKDGDMVVFKEIIVQNPDNSFANVKPIVFICSNDTPVGTCAELTGK